MFSKATTFVAVTALAALPASFAAGGNSSGLGRAVVKNQCDEAVNLWSIGDKAGEEKTVVESGGEYSEKYQTDVEGGISIKLAFDEGKDEISQFEYTIHPDTQQVFYDLSNVNGYPFKKGGASITPSDDSCPAVECGAGVENCKDAYNQPFDDHATKGCNQEADLTLVLCPSSGQEKRNVRHPHWRYA